MRETRKAASRRVLAVHRDDHAKFCLRIKHNRDASLPAVEIVNGFAGV